MTMSDDQSADTPIFDSRRDAFEPETGVPVTVLPDGTYESTTGYTADGSSSEGGQSGVKDEAGRVAGSAADAGKAVAGTAKEQAKNVVGEAKSQAKDLYHQTTRELRDQAAQQQERVASGLHTVGDELEQMASSSEQNGLATDLVRQAAQRTHSIAGWLDQRDPGSLLNEVKSYARRNPGTFIAVAAVAGALAGRLTRALASGGDDSSTSGSSGSASTGVPETPSYTPGTAGVGGTVIGTGVVEDPYGDDVNELPELPGAGYTGGR